MHREAGRGDPVAEGQLALVGVVHADKATVGEVAEASFEQMRRREAHHLVIVRLDQGQANVEEQTAHVHGRQAASADGAHELAVLDARDDAVAVEVGQPAGRVAQAAVVEVDRPGAVQTNILGDAV